MNDRQLLKLPLVIIVHPVYDKVEDFKMIINMTEMRRQFTRLAQVLRNDDNENDKKYRESGKGLEEIEETQCRAQEEITFVNEFEVDAFYQCVRELHDPTIWDSVIGTKENQFDDVYDIATIELCKPIDIKYEFSKEENEFCNK